MPVALTPVNYSSFDVYASGNDLKSVSLVVFNFASRSVVTYLLTFSPKAENAVKTSLELVTDTLAGVSYSVTYDDVHNKYNINGLTGFASVSVVGAYLYLYFDFCIFTILEILTTTTTATNSRIFKIELSTVSTYPDTFHDLSYDGQPVDLSLPSIMSELLSLKSVIDEVKLNTMPVSVPVVTSSNSPFSPIFSSYVVVDFGRHYLPLNNSTTTIDYYDIFDFNTNSVKSLLVRFNEDGSPFEFSLTCDNVSMVLPFVYDPKASLYSFSDYNFRLKFDILFPHLFYFCYDFRSLVVTDCSICRASSAFLVYRFNVVDYVELRDFMRSCATSYVPSSAFVGSTASDLIPFANALATEYSKNNSAFKVVRSLNAWASKKDIQINKMFEDVSGLADNLSGIRVTTSSLGAFADIVESTERVLVPCWAKLQGQLQSLSLFVMNYAAHTDNYYTHLLRLETLIGGDDRTRGVRDLTVRLDGHGTILEDALLICSDLRSIVRPYENYLLPSVEFPPEHTYNFYSLGDLFAYLALSLKGYKTKLTGYPVTCLSPATGSNTAVNVDFNDIYQKLDFLTNKISNMNAGFSSAVGALNSIPSNLIDNLTDIRTVLDSLDFTALHDFVLPDGLTPIDVTTFGGHYSKFAVGDVVTYGAYGLWEVIKVSFIFVSEDLYQPIYQVRQKIDTVELKYRYNLVPQDVLSQHIPTQEVF